MRHQGRPTRKSPNREVGKRILVVCEGEKTEPNYFISFRESLRNPLVLVEVEGLGANTDSLVEKAINIKRKATRNKETFDIVWVVFDRDSFPAHNFNRAIQLANSNDIKLAYSNEAFELWYLLHFDYHNAGISRHQYSSILTSRLGFPYQKNDERMYASLEPRQENAISNAKRLIATYTPRNPERDNPSTTVHELVQELNTYRK